MNTEDALAALGVEIRHHFTAGVYCKQSIAEPGSEMRKHVHPYDHLSVLVYGTVDVEIDGKVERMTAPRVLVVEAGKEHRIRGVTKFMWLCIHKTDDTNPDTVDVSLMSKIVGD
jgi:quercetin dioxygenase-like cupin family protein